jgi:hypothetical protein
MKSVGKNINSLASFVPWRFKLLLTIWLLFAGLVWPSLSAVRAGPPAQIPTVAVATVTGTPLGATVTVRRDTDQDFANVRSGPSTDYDAVGVLVAGQQAPALGRTSGGDWIKIVYPGGPGGEGWVYSPLVDLAGTVPLLEPPPTPTPRVTPTVDPTLAAQFVVDLPTARLPTYTAPPPLVISTYPAQEAGSAAGGVPMGFVIVGLFVVGFFGTLISLLRGR